MLRVWRLQKQAKLNTSHLARWKPIIPENSLTDLNRRHLYHLIKQLIWGLEVKVDNPWHFIYTPRHNYYLPLSASLNVGLQVGIRTMSGQGRNYSHNIDTISSRREMRIKNNINQGIISWSSTKFSDLTSQELYNRQLGELLMRYWEWKG